MISLSLLLGIFIISFILICYSYSFPTVIAQVRNKNSNLFDLVRGASNFASPMFEKFRKTGYFVGNDAWYCAFDHPDSALRGGLELLYPFASKSENGLELLLGYCISLLEESGAINQPQLLISYKFSLIEEEITTLAYLTLESSHFQNLCLISEPIFTMYNNSRHSALVVNIGSFQTTVTPVYESIAIRKCSTSTKIGGEHITDFLELLIDAQQIESYSSLLRRRRQFYSRLVKEKHSFVASSFSEAVEQYGEFTFEYVKVLDTESGDDNHVKNLRSIKTKETPSILKREEFSLNSGEKLAIEVDRELFYSSEILFSPELYELCQFEKSIVEIILQSIDLIDESVREEICKTILLTGKTSLLKGLVERLQTEVAVEFADREVFGLEIIVAEKEDSSAVFEGANGWINTFDGEIIDGQNILSASSFQKRGPSSLFHLD